MRNISLILLLASLAGCATYGDRGAAIGGLGGAGLGALIGEASGHGAEGALIGGALGLATGSAIGDAADRRNAEIQSRIGRQLSGAASTGDVVAMVQGGVSEEVIATHLRANGIQQRLQPGDLITLRNQGVSDYLINAMQTAPVGGPVAQQPVYGPVPYGPPVYAPQTVIVEERFIGQPVYYGPPRRWRGPYGPPPGPGFSFGISGS